MQKFIFVLGLLLCYNLNNVLGQKITLEEQTHTVQPANYMSYFISEKTLSIEDAIKQSFAPLNKGSKPNLGYESRNIWLKLNIKNPYPEKRWVFNVNAALLDEVDFYIFDKENLIESYLTGRNRPFNNRGSIKHTEPSFLLPFTNQVSNLTLIIRVKTESPLLLPFEIQTESAFYESSQAEHIYYGIYVGILAVMILYNLFIFITLRDINYLYYILCIVTTLIIFISVSGYLFKFIHPAIPEINDQLAKLTMGFTVIATALFANSFLSVSRYSKFFSKLLNIMIVVSIISMVLTGFKIYIKATNLAVSLQTVILLVVGIYCWKKGNKSARFYVLAWASYIIGGLAISLRNSGTLPINQFTTHGAEVGSILEVVLLSLALSDRYRLFKKEKEIATKKALTIQKQANENLEIKVQERTLQLQESNEELNQTNEELASTLDTVKQQKDEIERYNGEITASINYALRIQQSLLPDISQLKEVVDDILIFFKPRDLVSGDFYFYAEANNKQFLVAADCTGHGVPGAFMSMIGINILRELIVMRGLTNPNEILLKLHESVRENLRQRETGNRDGMDVAICMIDKQEKELVYAGAKNPLLYIQNNQATIIKADKRSVGGVIKNHKVTFNQHHIPLNGTSSFFIYSDGFQDQFGGKQDRKFLSKNFKKLLIDIHSFSSEVQHKKLSDTLTKWRGKQKQIDDILVLGFKA